MNVIKIIVYYHDTDAGGVVYYANYLKYLEEGRTEYFRDKGISIQQLHNDGFLYAVRSCNVTYKAPARYGDTIECVTTIEKISAAQIFFDQKIYHSENKQLLLKATVSLVSLNQEFKASPIPENIRSRLAS